MEDDALLAYTAIPTLDVPSTVSLASEVLTRSPKKAASTVRKATKRVRDALETLREAWESRAPQQAPEVTRKEADRRVDAAWSALHGRLSAWLSLPESVPERARASVLNDRLFEEGLGFLTLSYKEQWAEGDKRLRLIGQESLEADLVELVGARFLDEVREAQQLYGEVLGLVSERHEAPSDALVAKPLRALRSALRGYVIQVIALADEEDSASIATALHLLEPIARNRRPHRPTL